MRFPALLIPTVLLLGSCVIAVANEGTATHIDSYAQSVEKAICVLRGTDGNEAVEGVVSFTQMPDGVLIEAEVRGLAPGDHGFHVHEFGDVDCADGKCTGGHFNPTDERHGGPDALRRHVGDLGNIHAGADGIGRYHRLDRVIQLGGLHSVVGRAIIVHAGADDLESQPTGDAGARLAYGVIGIAKVDE